ncbi:unnamed protein product [Rotaria sordida]|uniref:Intradiol ring-cleavage dioxygenases domain-containing protein n=1 Tax=Rotaria sordida TaxID=392033 RepID=A0A814JIV7_9BILA|nr:unnamed protein product [Rotaria sordida]CAF1451930.1 unnamed protein product [Rotaria sordida]
MLLKLIFVLIAVVHTGLCEHESVKRCARAVSACHLTPQGTEGPYYWKSTVRRNITEGKPGTPLRLLITVLDWRTCSPVPNAVVDVWQCDALGIYSHFIGASMGYFEAKSDNTTFFRGTLVSDLEGRVVFDTIYPGWYRGRATHIHIKVHIGANLTNIDGEMYATGGHVSHTGQFYFDDNLTDKVATVAPYMTNNIRRTRNNEDGIYTSEDGASMIAPIQFLTNEFTGGMKTEVTVAIDPTATPELLDNIP